jgi:cytochrome c biogenesis protein CcdA
VTATLGYAFALGFVAAINPCGFPLLPAYLTFFAEGERTIVGARRTVKVLTI